MIGPNGLAQFANAQQVSLRSYTNIGFAGDVTVNFANSVDLSAGGFTSDGRRGRHQRAADRLHQRPRRDGSDLRHRHRIAHRQRRPDRFRLGQQDRLGLRFGGGQRVRGIVGQGTGTFDFGALPVTLNAPIFLADTGSNATAFEPDAHHHRRADPEPGRGTALAITPVGGAIGFVGGSIVDNGAVIEAPAGNVSLEAKTGDLDIASGSLVSSAGVAKQFFDVTEYCAGRKHHADGGCGHHQCAVRRDARLLRRARRRVLRAA